MPGLSTVVDIVHVLDASDQDGATMIAQAADVARLVAGEHSAFIVGPRSGERLAAALGLSVVGSFCPPLRSPALARRSLRRALAAHPSRVVAWWGTPVLGAGEARCVRSDNPPPFVDATRLAGDRATLRARWNAGDETMVVGLLGDPPSRLDARRAAEIVGIAAVRGVDIRLIVHPATARFGMTAPWLQELALDRLMVGDEAMARPWETVAGLDVALVLGDGLATAGAAAADPRFRMFGAALRQPIPLSPLPGLWAQAAGVPILAERGVLDAGLPSAEFDLDDPLHGTRALIAWSANRGLLRAATDQPRSRAASTAELRGAWARFLGVL